MRGVLLALEGVDRCGKTTQVARLAETLRQHGHTVETWRFPDRTTATGKLLDAYLSRAAEMDGRVAHLLFSANRWEKADQLLRTLQRGVHVLLDRYAYSGVAFSAAVNQLDIDWCRATERGLPAPDRVLYLDVSPAAAAARGGYGGERYESLPLQEQVRRVFLEHLYDAERWRVVPADGSVEQVHQQLLPLVLECVEAAEHHNTPMDTLW